MGMLGLPHLHDATEGAKAMTRGPRTRERLYVVQRLALPSSNPKNERRASLVVEAESPELAALACARFCGARAAPFRFEVTPLPFRGGRTERLTIGRVHPTFRPGEAEWAIENDSHPGETKCIRD